MSASRDCSPEFECTGDLPQVDAVERLVAIDDIRQVKARYCRLLDTRDWASWAALFTEDAVLDVSEDVDPRTGNAVLRGRAAIVDAVEAVVRYAVTAHQVHSPEIAFDDDCHARAIWAMQDRLVWQDGKAPIAARALTGFGHYHETYERRDAGWLIASLRLTRLNVEMDPL